MTSSWRDRRRRNTIKFRLTDLPCCKRMDSSIHKSRKPFLPPDYRHSNEILKLIKDKQRKLFHINDYDNPSRLKECYVRLCRNLPSCNAEIYVVKEIHGKRSKRKVDHSLTNFFFFSKRTLFSSLGQSITLHSFGQNLFARYENTYYLQRTTYR